MGLSNICKTAKVMKLTKETILESSYKYLQVKVPCVFKIKLLFYGLILLQFDDSN